MKIPLAEMEFCACCGYIKPQCECEKKQTNAQRIRAMSDEELAEFSIRQHACEHCDYLGHNATCKAPSGFTCTNGYAEALMLKWLQSEVKE